MKEKIIVALVFLGIFLVVIILGCFDYDLDMKYYNNGFCYECGGSYEFAGVTQTKHYQNRYNYRCKDCYYTIQTSYNCEYLSNESEE